jgi:hypothetical protein
MKVQVTVTHEIDLDLKTVAAWFAHLSDDDQAKFFGEVQAAVDRTWERPEAAHNQWWYIGRHIATCECARAGRDMIQGIADAMNEKAPPAQTGGASVDQS